MWWVELAALDRPADQDALTRLAETIIGALDIRDGAASGQPAEPVTAVDRLADALRPRRLLLVLDNCEHVVEPLSELAERLLRSAPGIRLLATSQEPLGLAGEVVWGVPPLEVPGHAADLAANWPRRGCAPWACTAWSTAWTTASGCCPPDTAAPRRASRPWRR
ncbi:hypothetical protein [Nonomuraea sp. NPDC048916]|uniref:hypothetical protein n=1 Tax=Nonomuraea sp. NPDC048916 TaxID=3154232 RepID=UPI0033BFEB4F